MAGHLVIPRFTMGISRDADGVTRRWATAVGPADAALPDTDELFDAVIWQYGTTPDGRRRPRASPNCSTPMTSSGYAAMVADAVAAMAEPGAALRKVVLSRPVDGPPRRAAPPRRPCCAGCAPASRNCTIFSMPVPDGAFFGASPELLVARHGTRVSCHPLAGTVPRGATARADADAQRDLARSAKNREEHRYVVDEIAATLAPFCDELSVPERALAGRLPLGGPPRHADRGPAGPARRGARAPRAAPSHPGRRAARPATDALAFIARPRGRRAGLLGRSGRLGRGRRRRGVDDRHPQRPARTPTGPRSRSAPARGIVADSDPDAEAAETNVKLATVLDAVVPGASVQLR